MMPRLITSDRRPLQKWPDCPFKPKSPRFQWQKIPADSAAGFLLELGLIILIYWWLIASQTEQSHLMGQKWPSSHQLMTLYSFFSPNISNFIKKRESQRREINLNFCHQGSFFVQIFQDCKWFTSDLINVVYPLGF